MAGFGCPAAHGQRPEVHCRSARAAPAPPARPSRVLPSCSQEQIDAIVGAMADAVTPACRGARQAGRRGNRLRRRRRQGPEEPVRFAAGLRVHPADADGRRHRPARGSEDHRDRGTVRRGRRHRPVDQPHVNGHLQGAHRAESAMPDRHQSASVRRQVHHTDRRAHGRRRDAGRRASRQHRLDEHRHARRHAGVDEGARSCRHPGHRRHGPRARGLQCRQARVRRRARAMRPVTSNDRPISRKPPATS